MMSSTKVFPMSRSRLRRCVKSVRWKREDFDVFLQRAFSSVAQTSPSTTLLTNPYPNPNPDSASPNATVPYVHFSKPRQLYSRFTCRTFTTGNGNKRQKESLTETKSDQSPVPKANRTETALVDVTQQGALTDEEVKQREHIRALVSQLYMALNVPETYQQDMENMQNQLDEIKAALQPLEEEKLRLLIRAERRSKVLAWAGLGFMGTQFGFLARLTWWDYSCADTVAKWEAGKRNVLHCYRKWRTLPASSNGSVRHLRDIIEPVTYFVTYGTAMVLYSYFLVTRQDTNFPAVTERWTAVAFHKKARKSKWEMDRYIQLRDKMAKLQTDLEKMNVSNFAKPSKTANSLKDAPGTTGTSTA